GAKRLINISSAPPGDRVQISYTGITCSTLQFYGVYYHLNGTFGCFCGTFQLFIKYSAISSAGSSFGDHFRITFSSRSIVNGLLIKSFIPACLHLFSSSLSTFAVMAIIGGASLPYLFRIYI